MSRPARARATACVAALLCSGACDRPPAPSQASSAAAGVQAPAAAAGASANAPDIAASAGDAAAEPQSPAGANENTDAKHDAGARPQRTRISLIDHARWTRLEREDDPFPDRPAELDCAAEAVAPEALSGELALGVDTGGCRYVTVRQTTRAPIAIGETVVVRLWHFALSAPAPAQAHAAIDVGGVTVLDERVEIPAPGGLIKVEVVIDHAMAAGAPVHFHLHNHGANSWALVEVSAGPPGASAPP